MSLRSLLGKGPPRLRLCLAAALYGLAGGAVAVAFHSNVDNGTDTNGRIKLHYGGAVKPNR